MFEERPSERREQAVHEQLLRILRKRFGYQNFRTGQEEILSALCQGSDVFSMMPTGSGKSLCYQLPGYLFNGLVLVVSPLLALMEDQVLSIRKLGEKKVRALNSLVHPREKQRILQSLSRLRFLFISPETLRKPDVIRALEGIQISLFVIDEAHCVSQWGYDFRPDYLHLLEIRRQIGNPQCLALTATAGQRIRADILARLGLSQARQFIYSADRPNIAIDVRESESNQEKISDLLRLLRQVELPAIIYCASRDWSERLARVIHEQVGLTSAFYHGGMETDDRMKIQNQFLQGDLPILCCTNAFGMGVNLPNVRLVVHFHYPSSIHAYLQEIGRAGRDGGQSLAVLYHTASDDQMPERLIENNYPSDERLVSTLYDLDQGVLSVDKETEFSAALLEKGENETAIRFLLDQVKGKKEGVTYRSLLESCRQTIAKRRGRKLAELAEMRAWLTTSGCRRRAYLRLYNETLTNQPQWCCDHCGLSDELFQKREQDQQRIPVLHWRDRLETLLSAETPAASAANEQTTNH